MDAQWMVSIDRCQRFVVSSRFIVYNSLSSVIANHDETFYTVLHFGFVVHSTCVHTVIDVFILRPDEPQFSLYMVSIATRGMAVVAILVLAGSSQSYAHVHMNLRIRRVGEGSLTPMDAVAVAGRPLESPIYRP